MATRTLEQILGDLGGVYDPQVHSIRQKQNLIPQQVADEERGLQAKQSASFDEILGGARRRGVGFSGLPIAEQARYNATEYMPALARLRSNARQNALSLEDAILGINERRYTNANQILQTEKDNDYRERQFAEDSRRYNESLAEQRRQQAQQNAQNSYMNKLFGGGTQNINPKSGGLAPVKVNPADQQLFNQMFVNPKGGMWSDKDLVNDYNATRKSAGYGNARDKQKLAFYHSFRPDLFGGAVPISSVSNGGSLRY